MEVASRTEKVTHLEVDASQEKSDQGQPQSDSNVVKLVDLIWVYVRTTKEMLQIIKMLD